ncbi:MAG: GNAT family N-acetyltransferase [Pseudomonadota bacterium]
MQLETDRLLIRYFRDEDLSRYAPIAKDPEVMKFLGGPQTDKEIEHYVNEMVELSKQGLGRFVVTLKDTEELIGFCGYRPAGAYVDFGYRYARHTWGQGFGLEAALAVREYGVTVLALDNIEAGAATENIASIKILEQLGFRHREEVLFEGHPSIRFRDTLGLDDVAKSSR